VRMVYRGSTLQAERFFTPVATEALVSGARLGAAATGQLALLARQAPPMRMRTETWRQALCVGVQVAIADPIGRTAVWTGIARHSGLTPYLAAAHALGDPVAALYWHPTRTRGGARCLRPMALAAARVLHARTFDDPPAEHDVLLAEFARRRTRPPTAALLHASVDTLAAASALYQIQQDAVAVALIKLAGQFEPAPGQP